MTSLQTQSRFPLSTYKVSKISAQKKSNLIESVINDHFSIHQASRIHQINYSSAKYIINKYRKKVDQGSSKFNTRKQRKHVNSELIQIDLNTGDIIIKQISKEKPRLSLQDQISIPQLPYSILDAQIYGISKEMCKYISDESIVKIKDKALMESNKLKFEELVQLIAYQHNQMGR